MAQVRDQLLKLALRVDPTVRSTNTFFDLSTIGGSDGNKFSKQRLLDIYNEARTTAFNVLKAKGDLSGVKGTLRTGTLSFVAAGGRSSANLPADFIAYESAYSTASVLEGTGNKVPIVIEEDTTLIPSVLDGSLNVGNGGILVFEIGSTLVDPTGTYTSGGVLFYYGFGDWTLGDLTATETFKARIHPHLITIAQAIALGTGNADAIKLAEKLLEEA
jgi:hypothetical protein